MSLASILIIGFMVGLAVSLFIWSMRIRPRRYNPRYKRYGQNVRVDDKWMQNRD